MRRNQQGSSGGDNKNKALLDKLQKPNFQGGGSGAGAAGDHGRQGPMVHAHKVGSRLAWWAHDGINVWYLWGWGLTG